MRIVDQQPANFKTRRTTAWLVLTRRFTMNKENRIALDRDLSSGLIESPIHPLLSNMVRPYVDSSD